MDDHSSRQKDLHVCDITMGTNPAYATTATIKMNTNPAYGDIDTIKMDTNPAYATTSH